MHIFLADHHAIYRSGLASFLRKLSFVANVEEASSVTESLARLTTSKWHLLLADIDLPTGGGLELVRAAKAEHLMQKSAVLMQDTRDEAIIAAVREGAEGCIAKSVSPQVLENIIKRSSEGFLLFSPDLEERFFVRIQQALQGGGAFSHCDRRITWREQEVLRLLQLGLSNKEIAQKLCISENTVKNHVRNIIEKFQVQNRVQAVACATRENLLRVDSLLPVSPDLSLG